MSYRFPRLVFTLPLLAPLFLHAQTAPPVPASAATPAPVATPALPPNAELILRDLDAIEKQHEQAVLVAWRAALGKIRQGVDQGPAAASLYRQAVEETQFSGKARSAAGYSEWMKKFGDTLQSKEMQKVLLLHLKYLDLSLQRNGAEKPELFVAPSLAFAQELAKSDVLFLKQEREIEDLKLDKDRGARLSVREKEDQDIMGKVLVFKKELLDKSLKDSVFTKWLRLEQWLPKKDWELTPGNLSGILSKNVRPYLLAAKDRQVGDTWIFEMQFLADRVVFNKLQHAAVDFDTVTRPTMQFNRANDMIAVGDLNGGVTEIYGLVKKYPQHADFQKWVDRLRKLLSPSVPATAPADAGAVEATPTPEGTSAQ